MLRYLPGILIVQLITVAIFWANRTQDLPSLWVSAVLPIGLIGFVTAFWFSSVAKADGERLIGKVRSEHAKEREKLQLDAEKDKAKVFKQTQKTIRREERRVGRRANIKVGLAFAGAALAGVVMIITELLTLGLMTITTAGGAMGGYLLRWKQAHLSTTDNTLDSANYKVINPPESSGELVSTSTDSIEKN